MQVIRESAEHHFLTTLEKLKSNPKNWIILHFSLSVLHSHEDFVKNIAGMADRIRHVQEESSVCLEQCAAQAAGLEKGFLYLFADGDIVLLAYAAQEEEKQHIQSIFKTVKAQFQTELSENGVLANELYKYQKLVDRKLLSARRFEAYRQMCDQNRIDSLALRRTRREETIVLLVDDDRFTASYASGILSKEFEVLLCRSGEEAIITYLEQAPDIVFLDIHLPGLSGHETLQAIRAIDHDACVVMVSIDTVKESIQKASEMGAKSFIKKPFSKERLLNAVRSSPFVRSQFSVTVDEHTSF